MTDVRIAQRTERVVVGVDTHADVHVAAALDPLGRMLGRLEVGTSTRGYAQLLKWAHMFSPTTTFGVEGTGAYGAGLARFLVDAGCEVIEINRPDRRARRGHGKSDPIDAEAAARSVLAGGPLCIAKRDHDRVGMIRTLRVARRSALKMRTQVRNQMHALVVTAPDSAISFAIFPSTSWSRSPQLRGREPSLQRPPRASSRSVRWRSAIKG